MKVSANGIQVAHEFEGLQLKAYPDPGSADGKPWTIGYGHTGPEVVKGLVWTKAQADATFVADLAKFEARAAKFVTVPLTQGQFDAIVLFDYNTGALGSSTLLKKLNSKDYAGAREEFKRWNKNDGQVMKGLTRRRAAEVGLWDGMSGDKAIAAGRAA